MRWTERLARRRRKTRTRRALINLMVHDGRSVGRAQERMRLVSGILASMGFIVKIVDHGNAIAVAIDSNRVFNDDTIRYGRCLLLPWWMFVIRGSCVQDIIRKAARRIKHPAHKAWIFV